MKRVEVADSLRGFSLIGIFLANLLIFQFGLSGQEYISYFHLNPVNYSVGILINIIFVHSFLPIFAILFGFSMDKLYQSMKTKNIKRPKLKLFRRSLGLLTLGFLHAIFIWEGDILTSYAIAMLILIPFISFKIKFFKWVTIIGFILLSLFFIGSFFDSTNTEPSSHEKATYVSEVTQIYAHGSFHEIQNVDNKVKDPGLEMIKKDLGDSYGLLLLFSIFINFPLFTLGIYFSKSNWFEKNAKQFWSCKLFIYMIPIALIGKSIMYWSNHNNSTDGISFLSGTLLSIGIICLFKKVYQSHRQNWIMQNLKYMGKMSLTMYIMQSIIGTLIFYSYGLGLFGKDILLYIALLFIIIYIAQVYLATWYQRHLRYGPLEYLLRMFTYWKWNVNKK